MKQFIEKSLGRKRHMASLLKRFRITNQELQVSWKLIHVMKNRHCHPKTPLTPDKQALVLEVLEEEDMKICQESTTNALTEMTFIKSNVQKYIEI